MKAFILTMLLFSTGCSADSFFYSGPTGSYGYSSDVYGTQIYNPYQTYQPHFQQYYTPPIIIQRPIYPFYDNWNQRHEWREHHGHHGHHRDWDRD